MKCSLYLFILLVAIWSCESPADVELSPSTPTLVVDAFINDQSEAQRIFLNFSQSFFNNDQYAPATGATITITDDQGNPPQVFSETDIAGEYMWEPTLAQSTIGAIGANYTLTIDYEGDVFTSTTTMARTTPIQEIEFYEEQEPFSEDIFYEGRFTARDIPGIGDAYWVKTFWNGEFLGDPSELNIAFDAGLSPGGGIDGQEFIIPIRSGINPTGEDESFDVGDVVRVEVHSISRQAYDYFIQLQIQTDRPGGFAELFAQPLANLDSNIQPQNNDDTKVLGFFSMSAVSRMEVIFTEDLIIAQEE